MKQSRHPNENIHKAIDAVFKQLNLTYTISTYKDSHPNLKDYTNWGYLARQQRPHLDVKVYATSPELSAGLLISRSKTKYIFLEDYVRAIVKSNKLTDLSDQVARNRINREDYILTCIAIFREYLATPEIQSILKGEKWIDVPFDWG